MGVNSISGSSSRSIFVLQLLRVHSISSYSPIYVSPYIRGVNSRSGSSSIFGWGSTPDSAIFYFSSAILIALKDNLEPTVLCRLRDFFKNQIYMHSYSLLLVNSTFCCVLHFLTFSCVCQIYVAEVLIIHYCSYCHLRFYHHISTKVGSIFKGGQLHLCITPDPYSCCIFSGSTPSPAPVWYMYLSWWGQLQIWIHLQFCLSQYYLHYVYISHIFYFSSAILIALNDNLELTVLCRLRDFFKDEIDMCSYSLLLVNSIFCCEVNFFLLFHVYARYM